MQCILESMRDSRIYLEGDIPAEVSRLRTLATNHRIIRGCRTVRNHTLWRLLRRMGVIIKRVDDIDGPKGETICVGVGGILATRVRSSVQQEKSVRASSCSIFFRVSSSWPMLREVLFYAFCIKYRTDARISYLSQRFPCSMPPTPPA